MHVEPCLGASDVTAVPPPPPQRALETLGLAYEEQMEVFKLVAVVLKVGNLTFTSVNNIDGTEGCANENEYGEC